jgi:signal transduction histidine kinase
MNLKPANILGYELHELLKMNIRDILAPEVRGQFAGGFDAQEHLSAGRGLSLGLLGMQERVLQLGGKMEIDSAIGKGTTVRAQFPMHQDGLLP